MSTPGKFHRGNRERINRVNRVNSVMPTGAEEVGESPERCKANWPDPLSKEAFHGVAGEWVRAVGPQTEADPAALLVQFLAAFGNVIGRGPYFMVESDRHFTNLFVAIVGETAKSRKGTSWGRVKDIFREFDQAWVDKRVSSGLSSGEGLIWAVRDTTSGNVRGCGKKETKEAVTDFGVSDKRLLVMESEFAGVLQTIERNGNTLSAVIRDSWDTGVLSSLTKNSPARATGAHISIIGHITRHELKRYLTATAAANGFANRYLWVCSKRSKCLPFGGTLDLGKSDLKQRLSDALCFARNVKQMQWDPTARTIWASVYTDLSEGKPGLFGAVTSRAEAQVLRLSCLYALLDCSEMIRAEQLRAALAVWDYCEASARFIFGDALGDPIADKILRELRCRPDGMTRDQIRELFQRNKSSEEIAGALEVLEECGLACMERSLEGEGQKRPTQRWFSRVV